MWHPFPLHYQQAKDIYGNFAVNANGIYLANQPVDTMDVESTITAATVYFVPSFDYE